MGFANNTDYKSYGKSFEEMDEQEFAAPETTNENTEKTEE